MKNPFRRKRRASRTLDSARDRALRHQPGRQVVLRAKYDAAQTTDLNMFHWKNADALSADQANSYAVRKRTRERARLEAANNTYAFGIIADYANDVIGERGPSLQLTTKDREFNLVVEREWARWAAKMHLARKLRTMHRARVTDGEGFAVEISNDALDHPVKLDLRLLECDRVRSPDLMPKANDIDGVTLDEHGNPVTYQISDSHPGGGSWGQMNSSTPYEARFVYHWFTPWRPEQHRGVSEIMAALGLFAQLRAFTLATLTAAQTAASFAAVIQSTGPADGALSEDAVDPETMDTVELPPGVATVMPEGWGIGQVKAEHPNTTHDMFTTAILCAIARVVSMPRNKATGDSSGYNFASGRLDHGTYFKSIRIQQGDIGMDTMDRLFSRWFYEARLAFGWRVANDQAPAHHWLWEQREPMDPREAKAETERLASGATGLPEIYAARGQDWRDEMVKNAEALGVPFTEYQALIRKRLFGAAEAEAEPEEDDDAETETEREERTAR